MRRSPFDLARILLVAAALAGMVADGADAVSSRDYPGPCFGEIVSFGTPLYLSADYHGTNRVYGVIVLGETGRFRLGVSCVATGFAVVRVGPDSALCTVYGLCTPSQLQAQLNETYIEAVRGIPGQVPFFHICKKHGFGWYDAVGVPAGIYLAVAESRSAIWGLVDGHGTMDTYAFEGNGGAYQPVNCPRPPVCGNWILEPGESCDDGNTVGGDCCDATCHVEPAGSPCPGNADLCTPGTCSGSGYCLHANQCIDEPIEGVKLKLQQKGNREILQWQARNQPATPPSAAVADPSVTGATLELYSPTAGMASMALPAAGWTVSSGGALKFHGSAGTSPVSVALVNRGKNLKLIARSTGFALDGPLVGVGIRLVSGTLATCSFFPASSVVRTEPGRFEAKGPGAISETCDRITLAGGVPGGDPNPGLPPDDPGDPGGGFCTGREICPVLPGEY
jgi:cysteine-rich repeat protein